MLQNLYVKNLALIDEIEVEFKPGLNILTGETGAGKSIILGSINLALGGRYSSDILRSEEEAGYVELNFLVEDESEVAALKALDIYPEDGIVTLSRKMIGKRSNSKINGETVGISTLKDVAEILIDIHGQHEHQSLLYKKNHLTILDTFAKEELKSAKEKVEGDYAVYKKYRDELLGANLDEKERNKEMSFLAFEIEEIRAANLKAQEDEVLEEQYRRMVNGKKITGNLEEAYGYTASNNGNASDALSRAISCLQDAARYDEKAAELFNQLAEVDNLLNDFNRELGGFCDSFEFSEEEFYEVEKRLNEINRLKSKYGNSIDEIFTYLADKEETLKKLEDYDAYLETLRRNLSDAEQELASACEVLTMLRREAATRLTAAIKEGLLDLNFLDVAFEMKFTDLENYTAGGKDEVEFLISTNPGEPVKPLVDVASGGELSRIMLAIKTVLAEKDRIETLIFDEIDVGISGRTAQKVSEKMAYIARSHQVICITHLAQIAAMADAHFAIEKKVSEGKTKTGISLLSPEEEIAELARILGGAEITDSVMYSAAEMKQLAKRAK